MRRRAAALLLLCLPLLPGCWSRQELGEVDLTMAVGLDRAAQGYRLSVQVAVAPEPGVSSGGGGAGGGGGGQSGTAVTVAVDAPSPANALFHLRNLLPKRPVWTHVDVIVVGEELARSGLSVPLDFAVRTLRVRDDAWLVVARGRAEDLLRARPPGDALPARGLRRILEQSIGQSMVPRRGTAIDFFSVVEDPGIDPVLPLVTVGPQQRLSLDGLAVLRKDRLVGALGDAATHGFNLVRGGAATGTLAFACAGGPTPDSYLRVIRRKSRIEPSLAAGRPRVRIDVLLRAVVEDRLCRQPLASPAAIRQAEAQAGAAARERVQAAVQTAARLGADIFGFGREFWRNWPGPALAMLRRGPAYLPALPVEVVVRVNLDSIGEIMDYVPGGYGAGLEGGKP